MRREGESERMRIFYRDSESTGGRMELCFGTLYLQALASETPESPVELNQT